MGFAEIQAAFAATGAAPLPAQPDNRSAPNLPGPAFTPSPFQPTAFVPPATAPAAPPAFQFVPPPNAATPPNGGPWSPINPPGERVALGAVPVVPTPVQVGAAVAALTAPTGALHNLKVTDVPPGAVTVGPTGAPPKRKRRTKAEMAAAQSTPAGVIQGVTIDELGQIHAAGQAMVEEFDREMDALAAQAKCQELKDLPADGSTVEDIVEELFARGVTQVNLTFAKFGRT